MYTGERNLDAYMGDEVAFNRTGYAWGREWIRENPLEFLKLVIKKQGILLGADTTGVYWTLERGHGNTGLLYQGLEAISNIWWVGVWVLAVIGVIRGRCFFVNKPIGSLLL